VPAEAGAGPDVVHIGFTAPNVTPSVDQPFGGSIPVSKANPDEVPAGLASIFREAA
jgi:hypothetical protein